MNNYLQVDVPRGLWRKGSLAAVKRFNLFDQYIIHIHIIN